MTNTLPRYLLKRLVNLLNEEGGTDIILSADSHPAIRVQGKIRYVKDVSLSAQDTFDIARDLMNDEQWLLFTEQAKDIYFTVALPELFFLRSTAYHHRGRVGMVFHLLPLKPPTFGQLNLPDLFKEFALRKQGIILFSGPAGVGKSHSLAAMINYRNQLLSEHIVTLEEPVEFIHSNQRAIVTQREIGVDCGDMESMLKSLSKQSINTLMISEICDAEVMKQVLLFAQTGHTVFSSIYASTVRHTLDRIINFFPHHRRNHILFELSNNLQLIVNQRLLTSIRGKGQVVALEIMQVTSEVKKFIREYRFEEIEKLMKNASLEKGLVSIDNYIISLYEAGKVSYEEACKYIDSSNKFKISSLQSGEKESAVFHELTPLKDVQDWALEDSVSDRDSTWGSFRK